MSRIFGDLRDSPHHPSTPVHSPTPTGLKKFSTQTVPHVCIVGAGIAGLRCADVLLQSNIKVTILEGRNRVGGRVHQAKVGNHLVDVGPNWIHGNKGNPIATIAKRTGTITQGTDDEDEDDKEVLYDSTGEIVPRRISSKLSKVFWDLIVQAFQYSNDNSADIPKDKSLLDYIQENLDRPDLSEENKELVRKIAYMWGYFVGDSIERQSLKFFFLEECVEGGNEFVASTYKKILKDIAKKAQEKADIHLNTEVISIKSLPRSPNKPHKVTVKTHTGAEQEFDEVVVTCPLGWLKKNRQAFMPPLPDRISAAIDAISYGRLEKVYVTFPSAFWHRKPQTPSNGSNVTSTEHLSSNGACNGHIKEESKASHYHFLHPNYVSLPPKVPSSTSWDQECISLASLHEECAHPTLLFYVYGACSTYINQQISSIARESPKYYEALRDILYPFYSRLPTFSSEDPSCTPVAFFATTWQSDKFAGNGSYTNYQIGLEEADEDILAMREGRGLSDERGIWLAGEHTSPFIALGTTTGAYWAGEGVARRIARQYGIHCGVSTDGFSEKAADAIKKMGERQVTAFEDMIEGRPPGTANGPVQVDKTHEQESVNLSAFERW